ncbi:glutathione S-transferase [Artemisia annua]|uniref:glutathione transferase n=1 Tax=Artemisia annua TaxID=35608 RepID=A0A2U1Q7R2_ARTAN|nr:glutathione S-transferase [Artemisia annua]
MEKGFLSPKGRGSGKGVKEKQGSVVGDIGKTCNRASDDTGGSTTDLADQIGSGYEDLKSTLANRYEKVTTSTSNSSPQVAAPSGNTDTHVSDSYVNVESSNQEKPISLDTTVGGNVDVNEAPAINPMSQVPAIVDGGFTLFESHAILIYLSGAYPRVASHWYPDNLHERAKVHSVLDWHHSNLRRGSVGVIINTVLGPLNGLPSSPQAAEEAEKILAKSLSILEDFWLEDGPFLVGRSQPSIADLNLVCEIMELELLSEKDRYRILSPYKKVLKWVENTKNATAPHFDEVHGVLFKAKKGIQEQIATKSGHYASANERSLGLSLSSSGDFLVKSVRTLLDDFLLPKFDVPTRWINVVPIKAWRFPPFFVRHATFFGGILIPFILFLLFGSSGWVADDVESIANSSKVVSYIPEILVESKIVDASGTCWVADDVESIANSSKDKGEQGFSCLFKRATGRRAAVSLAVVAADVAISLQPNV